ncbi:MAG: hypothetical protein ACK4TA_08720 [Saprospiraceae bacterium]
MQEIKELIQILRTSNSLLDTTKPESEGGKLSALYDLIVSQTIQNDEEAAELLYGESKDNAGYKKLRGKLKNRLIDAVLNLDLGQFAHTQRQKAQCQCYKDWAAVKILVSKNANVAGISLCKRLLKRAKKYDFTELVMETASLLRVYYGTLGGDIQKFDHYNDLFKQYRAIWEQENLAEELYTELVIRYVKSKASQPEIYDKARQYYNRIAAAMSAYTSYRLHLSGNLLRMIIPTSVNNYQEASQLCDEIIHFFEKKAYIATIPLQIFWYQKIVCCIQLRQFAAGKNAIARCLNYMEEGTYNWFSIKQLNVLLAFHIKDYQQAYEDFTHLVNHPRYLSLPEHFGETTRIYGAYLYYLSAIRKIELSEKDRYFQNFRINKFINDTPIFSKDKRGMHIPILIIQILLLILERKYGAVIDKIEAVEKYCTRYLRKDDTFRSNCFIKMLLYIPLANFHRASVERKTQGLLARLQQVPIELAQQAHEVEIIPYEDLWEFALDSLQPTFYTPRSASATAK